MAHTLLLHAPENIPAAVVRERSSGVRSTGRVGASARTSIAHTAKQAAARSAARVATVERVSRIAFEVRGAFFFIFFFSFFFHPFLFRSTA